MLFLVVVMTLGCSTSKIKWIETTNTIDHFIIDTIYCDVGDTVLKVDTIIRREVKVVREPFYVKTTRDIRKATRDSFKYEILKARVETRSLRDSLKTIVKLEKINTKAEVKIKKRNNSRGWLRPVYVVLGLLVIGYYFRRL